MITPFCTATPNRAMNPTALDTLSVMPRSISAINPPKRRHRHDRQNESSVPDRAERRVQQDKNQREYARNDHRKPLLRPLLVFKLAAPLELILL